MSRVAFIPNDDRKLSLSVMKWQVFKFSTKLSPRLAEVDLEVKELLELNSSGGWGG